MAYSSKSISRRSVLRGAGVLAGGAALAGLANRPALAASELRVLMAGGSWGEWVANIFAKPFTQAHGVEFIWKYGIGQEPILMAQRRRPQWDLCHSSQTKAGQLMEMGIYRPYEEARIPNIAKIHPSFRSEQLVGKLHSPYGLCVNTKEITRPVDSWLDLWDPAFKGKVAFPAWNWQGEEVFHALNTIFGGQIDNIEPGIAKLKELFSSNDAKIINNVEHTGQLLASGDVWICPYFRNRTLQSGDSGVPVEFIIPKEGGLTWSWNMALVANRPEDSMEMADRFIDSTLDAEVQIEFARLHNNPPTNIDAIGNLPSDLQRLSLTNEEMELLAKLQQGVDYTAMFAFRDQYTERWNKEVLSAN